MKRYRRVIEIIFRPGGTQICFLLLLSGVLLTVVFSKGLEQSALAYSSYVISAYSLVIAALRVFKLCKKYREKLHENAAYVKYKRDLDYKARLSIHVSLVVTGFYSVTKAAAGIWYSSAWLGSIALYYMLLTLARYLLLRYIRKGQRDKVTDYKKYRQTAVLLLILTLALSIVSIFTIYFERAIEYPGFMIYAAAAFSFYSLTIAVINQFRYKNLENPIFRAGKQLSMASACVSLYFLQCSLLSTFGNGAAWEKYMNMGTGAVVFLFITADAIFMIRKSTEYLHLSQNI